MDLGTIYLVCAVAGGTILVLRAILMVLGVDQGPGSTDVALDMDMDGVADASEGSGGGFSLLSMQSIAGFFTMFGLVGLGLLEINASNPVSLLGALAAGSLTAWATAMIFFNMRRLQSEGTLKVSNAVGQTGTVYLTIPEEGTGVVNVSVQGSLRTLDAISEDHRRIPTGRMVKVKAITAGKILVVSEVTADQS